MAAGLPPPTRSEARSRGDGAAVQAPDTGGHGCLLRSRSWVSAKEAMRRASRPGRSNQPSRPAIAGPWPPVDREVLPVARGSLCLGIVRAGEAEPRLAIDAQRCLRSVVLGGACPPDTTTSHRTHGETSDLSPKFALLWADCGRPVWTAPCRTRRLRVRCVVNERPFEENAAVPVTRCGDDCERRSLVPHLRPAKP